MGNWLSWSVRRSAEDNHKPIVVNARFSEPVPDSVEMPLFLFKKPHNDAERLDVVAQSMELPLFVASVMLSKMLETTSQLCGRQQLAARPAGSNSSAKKRAAVTWFALRLGMAGRKKMAEHIVCNFRRGCARIVGHAQLSKIRAAQRARLARGVCSSASYRMKLVSVYCPLSSSLLSLLSSLLLVRPL